MFNEVDVDKNNELNEQEWFEFWQNVIAHGYKVSSSPSPLQHAHMHVTRTVAFIFPPYPAPYPAPEGGGHRRRGGRDDEGRCVGRLEGRPHNLSAPLPSGARGSEASLWSVHHNPHRTRRRENDRALDPGIHALCIAIVSIRHQLLCDMSRLVTVPSATGFVQGRRR